MASATEAAKKRNGVFMVRVSTALSVEQSKTGDRWNMLAWVDARMLSCEVMKTITAGIAFCVVALSTALTYGGEQPNGVAAVNVALKQNPKKKVVTDAQGNFVLSAVPAGSYTLFV